MPKLIFNTPHPLNQKYHYRTWKKVDADGFEPLGMTGACGTHIVVARLKGHDKVMSFLLGQDHKYQPEYRKFELNKFQRKAHKELKEALLELGKIFNG
jgi:hypothetical protein